MIGYSSHEIVGKYIGTGSCVEAAQAVFAGIYPVLQKNGTHLAVQCCEYLNWALIVEHETAEQWDYEIVNVMPPAPRRRQLCGDRMERLL